MSIVANTDFVGEYKISQSCFSELDTYIEKFEKEYLCQLLGAELYDLFVADLTIATPQVPQATRFLDIFNAFNIDDSTCVRKSEGMRVMLKQFIYFHYMRDSNFQQTPTGVTRNVQELGEILPYNGWNLVRSFNEGVENYKEIQWYICDNMEDYTEENTQKLEFISGY